MTIFYTVKDSDHKSTVCAKGGQYELAGRTVFSGKFQKTGLK